MSKARSLLDDLARAATALDEASLRYAATPSDALIRDGLIQRFEFSFELAWKTIQAIAAEDGSMLRSPKPALAHALQSGWAVDEAIWFRMLEARNMTSHTYSESIAEELAREIPSFLEPLHGLIAQLRSLPRR